MLKKSCMKRAALILLLLATAGILSCGGTSEPQKRYELRGTIVSFDKDRREVVVSHGAIPDLMEAMTMPYTLKEPSAYDAMKAGDQITATLVVAGERTWLENPVIVHTESDPSSPQQASPSQPGEPQPGADVPDFTLTNQDGRQIKLSQYRGRALALTFIYTRCPLPDFCTLMSNNFAEIDRALEKDRALAARAHLLSVSVDPARDTPKVLRSYGAGHTGRYADEKFERWELATGDPAEVRRMASFFGLVYDEQGDQIVHSLRTAVVAP
ncbi:MAG: SCO family protein [Acidobacteria bacterium]|nr:SCO family protein [Acidobacteriota bacterium]